MSEKNAQELIVDSPLGQNKLDSTGAPISCVKLDPEDAYAQIPKLLQKYINNNDTSAWAKITKKINYLYQNVDIALTNLNGKTDFIRKFKSELSAGKKLLFKPNLVMPECIDPLTHDEGENHCICTEWPIFAALMRWFHDRFGINYFQMAVGEASTCSSMVSYNYSKITGRNITTEAVLEGRSGDFYGGWGFFFVRKYLAEHHPSSHIDDPMNGYEDSVAGRFIPPGRAGNRLMVYDLNRIQDDWSKGRTIKVPNGDNYKEITLHKVIIGGDKNNKDDMSDYPGCILINVPRLKMHAQDLITNAIKNLGIGLYPSECAEGKDKDDTNWKYASPDTTYPTLKAKLPHSRWVLKMDDQTLPLPYRNEDGKYVMERTEGFSGTQSDIISAIQSQNVFMLHVVDAINILNISHDTPANAVKVPEGYVWMSLDCVALDVFSARYCFKTVPMAIAIQLKAKHNWPTEFVQKVPVAKIANKNIITTYWYDSPLFRYNLFRYAQKRGIGQQKYYVIGWDSIEKTPLASLRGHLGRIDKGKFEELITNTLYYNPSTIIHDLQQTILSYAKAVDTLTGSSLYQNIMTGFDENSDGIIDYDEKALYETSQFSAWAYLLDAIMKENFGVLKGPFKAVSYITKNSNPDYNAQGHDFLKEKVLVMCAGLAFQLSQLDTIIPDPFIPEMSYGRGMWPSWETVMYVQKTSILYGAQSPDKITLSSLYGLAFQYSDKTSNAGAYTGTTDQTISDADSINNYFDAVSKGKTPLNFVLYVPPSYGSLKGVSIPNVEETSGPAKVFTAHFSEVW